LARAGERPEAGAPGRALPADALQALEGALRDAEPAVRAAAVEALGAGGGPEHAASIAALFTDGAVPPVVVVAALQALAALGPLPPDALARAAAHPDPEVVKEAVAAAARLPGEAAEALLRGAARSASWDVRRAAARALADRGDPALRELAVALAASDPDPLVARAFADAARALAG
ncbi:MAG: HEAT repeat domain-containing protein, partial [Gemmatimonadaceae bacterium]